MPSRVFLRAMERTVTHDHCDAQALLFKRSAVWREPLQAFPCRIVLRGCPRTRGFFGLQREHPATGPVRDSFRLISEFLQHCDRYLSHREFVQGTAQDAFVALTDNVEGERELGRRAVDHAGQTCHQPGQLSVVCCTLRDRHVPVAHPSLITTSVHRSTEGRTAILEDQIEDSKNECSHQHDCLRTTKSPPHSSQYGGEPAACKESCNSTQTMIVRVCLRPARLGKAHFQSRRALPCRT